MLLPWLCGTCQEMNWKIYEPLARTIYLTVYTYTWCINYDREITDMHYWLCRSMYGRTFDTLVVNSARLSYTVAGTQLSDFPRSRSSFAFRRNYTNSTEITSSACLMFAIVLQFPDGIATHRCANWHYHLLLRSNYIPVLAHVARCSSVFRQNRHAAALIRQSSAPGGLTGSLQTVLDTLAHPSEGTQLPDFLSISRSHYRTNSRIVCSWLHRRLDIRSPIRWAKGRTMELLPSHLIDANSLLSSILTPPNATVQRYYVRRCTDNVNWQFSVFKQNYRFIVFLIVNHYFIVSRVICSIWNPSIGKLIS